MSDIGTLSYEYQQASELAAKLERLLEQAASGPLERDLRLQVALALDGLVNLLDPLSDEAEHGDAAMSTPVGLVRRLRSAQFEGRQHADVLRVLRDRLAQGDEGLDEQDVRLLRDLTSATEHEAAVTFRRMVRR